MGVTLEGERDALLYVQEFVQFAVVRVVTEHLSMKNIEIWTVATELITSTEVSALSVDQEFTISSLGSGKSDNSLYGIDRFLNLSLEAIGVRVVNDENLVVSDVG